MNPTTDGVTAMDSGSSGAEVVRAIATAFQAAFIGLGGAWALYVYLRTRRGQVRVGIEASCRLIREWNAGRSLLLVHLRVANTSNVIYYHREATATLMDARRETDTGDVRLVPFTQGDPLPPVYGDIQRDSDSVRRGDLFRLEPAIVSLEPGEYVDSELAFVLETSKLGLMALRVLIRGRQRKWVRPRDYWWGSFFYVSPTETEELALTGSHSTTKGM